MSGGRRGGSSRSPQRRATRSGQKMKEEGVGSES